NRARDAAESAIRSPLLEDIDLHGARGILVNVTAGPDLTIGEFADVGEIIDEFASEQATVVIGTVIDAEMKDELKVTVVATGLGGISRQKVSVEKAPAHAVGSDIDYSKLDRPTVMRQQAARHHERSVDTSEARDLDYLDIPAFLRRQAD
ncbi:MAG TPA: cell division protein FtsZ, partial [Pseudomonadales bacterium]